MRNFIHFIWLLCCGTVLFASCHKKVTENAAAGQVDTTKGTYFSLRQFADDQFHTYHGYPFGFVRIHVVGDVKDSDVENTANVDWGFILKTFFAADIGEKKYLGRYNFNLFEDDMTATRNFLYEAKDASLYTQKLLISADQLNNRVRSIYIETEKHETFSSETQKLLYEPTKLIQIHRTEKNWFHTKNELIEYRFM